MKNKNQQILELTKKLLVAITQVCKLRIQLFLIRNLSINI
jgi:hypothetical protein